MLKICLWLLCCSRITENAKKSLASLKRQNPRLEPTLAVVQVTCVCVRAGWEREIPCGAAAPSKVQKRTMLKATFIQGKW